MTLPEKYLAARALLTAAGLAISVLATAQTVPAPPLAAATAEPERIILNLTADPQHEMAITWRSAVGSAPGMVQFAVSEPGPNFVKNTTEVAAKTEALTLDVQEQTGFQATYNSVVLTGLKTATRYVYRVGDGANWSEWFQFSTAGKPGDKFTFIYLGDAQNNIKEHWSRVLREALREDGKASFMLHAGDLINRHASDREWGSGSQQVALFMPRRRRS